MLPPPTEEIGLISKILSILGMARLTSRGAGWQDETSRCKLGVAAAACERAFLAFVVSLQWLPCSIRYNTSAEGPEIKIIATEQIECVSVIGPNDLPTLRLTGCFYF